MISKGETGVAVFLNPCPKNTPTRLKGKYYTDFRKQLWEMHNGKCSVCERWVPLNGPNVFSIAHVSHIKSRGAGGSDTFDNCTIKCYSCHIEKEHGLKWKTT